MDHQIALFFNFVALIVAVVAGIPFALNTIAITIWFVGGMQQKAKITPIFLLWPLLFGISLAYLLTIGLTV